LINQYVKQLSSKDPAQRREAIIALGKSNDGAALKSLAEVYRNDPDPTLRDLALRAGKHLRQQVGDDAVVAAVGGAAAALARPQAERLRREVSEYDEDESPTKPEPARPQKVIKETDRTLARSLTNEALTHNANNENAKALKALKTAIKANPEIIDDQFFLGVAGSVTGLEGREAVKLLLDDGGYKSKVKESKQATRQYIVDKHMEKARESKWSGVALEVLVFFVLNAVALVVLVLVMAEAGKMQANMSAVEAEAVDQMIASVPAIRVVEGLRDFTLPTLIAIGVVVALGATISMTIYGVILHVVSLLFSGKGTLPFLYDKLLGHYNKRMPIVYAIIAAGYFVTFGFGVPLAAIVLVYGGFRFIGVNRASMGVLREVYNFSAIMGILASIFASLAMSFVLFFINFIVSALLLGFIF
jgi:hypothetical protein